MIDLYRRYAIVRNREDMEWLDEGEIPVTAVQYDFIFSNALYRKFSGGRAAGKSRVGVEAAVLASGVPGSTGCIVAPTYPSLNDIVLPAFMEVSLGVLRGYMKSTRVATMVNGSKILFRSGEDPDRLRGPNLSWFWMDEACQQAEECWDILIACLREDRAGMGRAWLTTTPNGHDWVWELFETDDPAYATFRARMEDNPFTSKQYKQQVRNRYGVGWKARQELDGVECVIEGPIFSREWFIEREEPIEFRYCVRGWDLAASTKTGADYTVGVKVGIDYDGVAWVLEMVRGQWEWPRALEIIKLSARRDGGNCIQAIEVPGMQLALGQQVREALRGYGVRFVPRITDKVTHALPVANALQSGGMYFAHGMPGFERLVDEFVAFDGKPSKARKKDDMVDALANAYSCTVRAEPGIEVVAGVL